MALRVGTEKVIEAADQWKKKCLIDGGSIFSPMRLWTEKILLELEDLFINHPDEAKEKSFLDKLEGQLQNGTDEVKCLAAEILWLLFLFPVKHAMRPEVKIQQVMTVWLWSQKPFNSDSEYLSEEALRGIGHPGIAFNTHRYLEFAYVIRFCLEWLNLDEDNKQAVLGDPWVFAKWQENLPNKGFRQMFHVFRHLLFPNYFEPTAAGRQKREMLAGFKDHDLASDLNFPTKPDSFETDKLLYNLRKHLEPEFGEDFNFYESGIRDQWDPAHSSETPISDTTVPYSDSWYKEKFGDSKVWALAPGEGARLWQEFIDENIIALGYDDLGDYRQYPSKEDIEAELINQLELENKRPTMAALAVYNFANEMKEGDFVIAKKGRSQILGLGKITDEYTFDTEKPEYHNRRSIEWIYTGQWDLQREHWITNKVLTDFSSYTDWLSLAVAMMEGKQATEERDYANQNTQVQKYTFDQAMEDVFLQPEQFKEIVTTLKRKKNIILQGPPGVGKTFIARRVAYALMQQKADSRIHSVQFHQSFAYEDFVQGMRPTKEGGFEVANGIFYRVCKRAAENPSDSYVLIIDEINRGNLSRIFGEALMLIEGDKRSLEYGVSLTYSAAELELFFVPDNLYILGLMNTADRSLAMVDYALRRRFAFVNLKPQFASDGFMTFLTEKGVGEELLQRIISNFKRLNDAIREDSNNLGSGYEVGHSFFCSIPDDADFEPDEEWYEQIVRMEIAPLIHEYWFDRPEKANEIIHGLLL
jgi:MoxR-like ATPase